MPTCRTAILAATSSPHVAALLPALTRRAQFYIRFNRKKAEKVSEAILQQRETKTEENIVRIERVRKYKSKSKAEGKYDDVRDMCEYRLRPLCFQPPHRLICCRPVRRRRELGNNIAARLFTAPMAARARVAPERSATQTSLPMGTRKSEARTTSKNSFSPSPESAFVFSGPPARRGGGPSG